MRTPEQTVQEQLESYNERNIERFINCFGDSMELFNYFGNRLVITGKEAYRKMFTEIFDQSPQLNAVVLNRVVCGDIVIDHERISGRINTDEPFEMIMIYEVQNGKIIKATAIRK